MDNKLKGKLLCLLLLFAISTISMWLIFKISGEEKPKVFVVLKDLDSQYWNIIKAGAEKGFRDFELDGKVVAPSYKSKKDVQEYMLENIFNENPDVLIVAPEEASLPILDKYAEKNIPVLFVDTDYSWNNKTIFIGTNNYELGIKGGMLGSEL
ncbi:hypothetical protein WQ54_07285 [Bacillus sp. SA1-12]|nr:substrate-binding domain-containing protein [Bacillus sp. SA1-12]KKI92693.1 hypothetical protein WQ54_07285 [Bacillus sp. SA1-12]